ncbi:MAG: AAA family ATPase, partial [Acidobacteria bacterium]|nr:AAA family ATPase [Acidobacteriota bacterium]
DTAPADVDTVERHDAVPVVDPAEAMDLLFENGGNESDDEDGDGGAIASRRSGRPDPAPVVNLKHGRGPIPDDVLAVFRELCRQPKVDGVLELIDAAVAPLETAAVQELEEAHREVAALRQEEVTPERLGGAGGAAASDEAADRIARTCWGMRRRLGKVGDALERLDFSAMDVARTPSSFRRLLQRVEDDPVKNIPDEGLVAACDKALREFEEAAGLAVTRIRGVADARREVAAGEWNDAAVERIRSVVGRLEDAHQVLDGDTLPTDRVEAVREGLKELDEERRSADPQAATTREVLGQLEAADLPLPVLTRALDDIRMSQHAGQEAAAVLLERLRLVLDLPWTARAAERVDIAAAMAELDAAHAGRAALKERVRRFLATRQLTSARWTVEGRRPGHRPLGGDGSAAAGLCRLVVRPAQSAARAPVLCLAGPPGGGKTTLAKLIARALGRPGVLVALGGVWDESAIRGLPISFRSPHAGRVVLGLRKARVRNPVMILDEVD